MGNKIGLAVVAGTFIAFAILSSFVAPRRWPDFPGRQGLSVFVIVSFVLFAAQLTAIAVLAVEHEAHAAGNEGTATAAGKTIDVRESEFKIELPSLCCLPGAGPHCATIWRSHFSPRT